MLKRICSWKSANEPANVDVEKKWIYNSCAAILSAHGCALAMAVAQCDDDYDIEQQPQQQQRATKTVEIV